MSACLVEGIEQAAARVDREQAAREAEAGRRLATASTGADSAAGGLRGGSVRAPGAGVPDRHINGSAQVGCIETERLDTECLAVAKFPSPPHERVRCTWAPLQSTRRSSSRCPAVMPSTTLCYASWQARRQGRAPHPSARPCGRSMHQPQRAELGGAPRQGALELCRTSFERMM